MIQEEWGKQLQTKVSTLREYQKRIFRAMNHISEHSTENLSLDEISKVASFSKFHFHRIFKVFTGETVANFTRRIRLEKAASILSYDPSKNITDLAYDCGFSSSQNFAKQFKNNFGLSPSLFRQLHSGQKKYETSKNLLVPSPTLTFSEKEHRKRMSVTVQSLSAMKLAYLRFIGPYKTTETKKAIAKLQEILDKYQMEFSSIIGVAWDNPEISPAEKCRYDIGVAIQLDTDTPESLEIQLIPEGKYAIYHCEVFDNDLEKPWDDLITYWLPYSGYLPSGSPGYEIFHQYNDEKSKSPWIMDICLPLTHS